MRTSLPAQRGVTPSFAHHLDVITLTVMGNEADAGASFKGLHGVADFACLPLGKHPVNAVRDGHRAVGTFWPPARVGPVTPHGISGLGKQQVSF